MRQNGSHEQSQRQPQKKYPLFSNQLESHFTSSIFSEALIFALSGILFLCFLSYLFNIHSIEFTNSSGVSKQVGFLWAPNWAFQFSIVNPICLAFLSEILIYWKNDAREKIASLSQNENPTFKESYYWADKLAQANLSVWLCFIFCFLVAGIAQWVFTVLLPVLSGDAENYVIDWGRITLYHPEIISKTQSIIFTGLAYLYIGYCFFLYYAGLVLVISIVSDYSSLTKRSLDNLSIDNVVKVNEIRSRLFNGVFRVTILGIVILILLKIQSVYLRTVHPNFITWIKADIMSVFSQDQVQSFLTGVETPTQYSTIFPLIVICLFFLFTASTLVFTEKESFDQISSNLNMIKPTVIVFLLIVSFFALDNMTGFSLLLFCTFAISVYAIINPNLQKGDSNVL